MIHNSASPLLGTPKLIKRYSRSAHNIIILSICVVGMYLLYRYIKSIETDLYLLKAKVGEMCRMGGGGVSLPSTQESSHSSPLKSTIATSDNLKPSEYPLHADVCHNKNQERNSNDDDSVCSEDLANMLRTVLNSSGNDIAMCFSETFDHPPLASDIHIIEEKEDTYKNEMHAEIYEEEEENNTDVKTAGENEPETNADVKTADDNESETKEEPNVNELDDTQKEKKRLLEEELNTKTNDELRGILKDNGENTKGVKKVLVSRIVSMLMKN